MRAQDFYGPVFEDWLFDAILPFTAYASLAIPALIFYRGGDKTLFAVGFSLLLLIFIGLQNAWDAVTYTVFSIPSVAGSSRLTDEPNEMAEQ